MKTVKSRVLFLAWGGMATILLLFASCEQEEIYPNTPRIEYKELKYPDAGDSTYRIVISFTDGDGNFGLRPQDTTGIYSPDTATGNNLLVRRFEEFGGVFEKLDTGLTSVNDIRVPAPIKQSNGAMKGDIEIRLINGLYDTTSSATATKYSIQIRDRDLNLSNEVETPAFPHEEN